MSYYIKVKTPYVSPYILSIESKMEYLNILHDEILNLSPGDKMSVEVVEMADEDVDELNEFESITPDFDMNGFGDVEED